jgi:hypothetical protein
MSLSFLVFFTGLILWLVFTKWQRVADGWLAEFGRWCFIVGLAAYLFAVGSKTVW